MNTGKILSPEYVIIDRGYFGNGKLIGQTCKQVLRNRIRQIRAIRRRKKISDREMTARVHDFKTLLGKVAPAWLDEAKGQAEGAGIPIEELLFINCPPNGFYEPYGGCTTFLEIGRDENRLFKIRDERNHVQAFYIKYLPDGRSMQIGHDIGNLGYAHCLTNAPLAGANNTGSHTKAGTDDPLLNDCHLLRLIAERAKDTKQIPGILEQLLSMKATKGAGFKRGAIFLFADARRGLILECSPSDLVFKFCDQGTQIRSNHFLMPEAIKWQSKPANQNTLQRRRRMADLLKQFHQPSLLPEIFSMSRDIKNSPDSLCNDDKVHFWMTISAQLQVIPRRNTEKTVNYICCGHTRHSAYIPVPLAEKRSYVPLASGAFYKAADRRYARDSSREKAGKELRKLEKSFIKNICIQNPAAKVYRTLLNQDE